MKKKEGRKTTGRISKSLSKASKKIKESEEIVNGIIKPKVSIKKQQEAAEKGILLSQNSSAQAVVKFAAGVTKNMGNFESLRIDVGVELSCAVRNLDKTFTKAKTWVDVKMTESLDTAEDDKQVPV